MKKLILLLSLLLFQVGSIISLTGEIPAGAVVRQANFLITDERLTFQDILEEG